MLSQQLHILQLQTNHDAIILGQTFRDHPYQNIGILRQFMMLSQYWDTATNNSWSYHNTGVKLPKYHTAITILHTATNNSWHYHNIGILRQFMMLTQYWPTATNNSCCYHNIGLQRQTIHDHITLLAYCDKRLVILLQYRRTATNNSWCMLSQ